MDPKVCYVAGLGSSEWSHCKEGGEPFGPVHELVLCSWLPLGINIDGFLCWPARLQEWVSGGELLATVSLSGTQRSLGCILQYPLP